LKDGFDSRRDRHRLQPAPRVSCLKRHRNPARAVTACPLLPV